MTVPDRSLTLCFCGCGREVKIGRRFIHGHQSQQRPIVETAAPFKVDGIYCRLIPLLPLEAKLYAIVDAADYECLRFWPWRWGRYKKTFYALRRQWIDGVKRTIYMHREIHPSPPKRWTDHESGVGLDNRRKNLRDADYSENSANQMKRPGTKNRLKGTKERRNRWRSRIKHKGIEYYLGTFDTEEGAHAAYFAKAQELFGKFARKS